MTCTRIFMWVLFQELQDNTKFYDRHFEAIGVKTQIILFIYTTIFTLRFFKLIKQRL